MAPKNKQIRRYWDEGSEFAILIDEITFAWAGMKTKEYKKYKNLKKENLRDNMTNLELVLNMLAEASTTEISKTKVAQRGGAIAGNARIQLEKITRKSARKGN